MIEVCSSFTYVYKRRIKGTHKCKTEGMAQCLRGKRHAEETSIMKMSCINVGSRQSARLN